MLGLVNAASQKANSSTKANVAGVSSDIISSGTVDQMSELARSQQFSEMLSKYGLSPLNPAYYNMSDPVDRQQYAKDLQRLQTQVEAKQEEEQLNAFDPDLLGGSRGASDDLHNQLTQYGAEDYARILGAGDSYNDTANRASFALGNMASQDRYQGETIAAGQGAASLTQYERESQAAQSRAMEALYGLSQAPAGPSAAELQMNAGYDKMAGQNMALAASQRGGSSAAGTMYAMANNAAGGQQLAQQQAILRAQEEESRRQYQAQVLGQSAGIGASLQGAEASRVGQNIAAGYNYSALGAGTQQNAATLALQGKAAQMDAATGASAARAGYSGQNINAFTSEAANESAAAGANASRSATLASQALARSDAKDAATLATAGAALQTAGSIYGSSK